MTTRIYLDVDGVLNAVTRQTPEGTGWEMWEKVGVNGYTITYSPELIAGLNEIAEMDDVEIVWLTTWQANAKTMISPAIGLNGEDWGVALNPDMDAHGFAIHHPFGGWWKMNTLKNHVYTNPVDKIIWIDDDIAHEPTAPAWFEAFTQKTLAIAPFTVQGLTQHDACAIIDFINAS